MTAQATWNPALFELDEILTIGDLKASNITTAEKAAQASWLIREAYTRRQLAVTGINAAAVRSSYRDGLISLLFERNGEALGTFCLRLEPIAPALAGHAFAAELQHLREQGASLIELGRFAISAELDSIAARKVQAAMLNLLLIFSCELLDDKRRTAMVQLESHHWLPVMVIEVNPHHLHLWQELGWQVSAPSRWCWRVNAPSVLMSIECRHFVAAARSGQFLPQLFPAWRFVARYGPSDSEVAQAEQRLRIALAPAMARACQG